MVSQPARLPLTCGDRRVASWMEKVSSVVREAFRGMNPARTLSSHRQGHAVEREEEGEVCIWTHTHTHTLVPAPDPPCTYSFVLRELWKVMNNTSPFPIPNPSTGPFPIPNPSTGPFPIPNPSTGPFPIPNPSTGPFPIPNPSTSPFPSLALRAPKYTHTHTTHTHLCVLVSFSNWIIHLLQEGGAENLLQEGGAENSSNMVTALFRKAKALLQNSCLQRKTISFTNLHGKAAKAHPEFTGSSNEGPEGSTDSTAYNTDCEGSTSGSSKVATLLQRFASWLSTGEGK